MDAFGAKKNSKLLADRLKTCIKIETFMEVLKWQLVGIYASIVRL